MRDADSQKIFFEIDSSSFPEIDIADDTDFDQFRKIRYSFDKDFLTAKRIGTS